MGIEKINGKHRVAYFDDRPNIKNGFQSILKKSKGNI